MQRSILISLIPIFLLLITSCKPNHAQNSRERLSLNANWKFKKYESGSDSLIYDVRPAVEEHNDSKDADTEPTDAVSAESDQLILKPWIMPSGNDFIKDPSRHYVRPAGAPGQDFPFVQAEFDDQEWQTVQLPHDWGIAGPFQEGDQAAVGGGMGRLPSPGVAWYRRTVHLPATDQSKRIFLEVEGAMSYAMVWCNGHLVGGWPYGYNSWQLDLSPYVKFGEDNQLAIRLDNPPHSARWYPGGGLYRNVWLIKTHPVHVSPWGTFVHTPKVSKSEATLSVAVQVENDGEFPTEVELQTEIYSLNEDGEPTGTQAILVFPAEKHVIPATGHQLIAQESVLSNPKLWGPPPKQKPNRYLAVHKVILDGQVIDTYETPFGIRSLDFDPTRGLLVNGEHIRIQGVNQHHDLGALGAAFNRRAAERQLEVLRELGCNAIRMAHNPPAPELLELTDQMGFLVVNEIFDVWERKKTPLDFHLIFPDWYEQDLRAWVRRDRNHPSVIAWSYGNEVGEQYTDVAGAELSSTLRDIIKEEDPTRPTTASMNFAKPHMPFPGPVDLINLNYQGEGIRDAPAYAHLKGITTPPLYPAFRDSFPEKVIISSETAAAVSSRGTYLFPVAEGHSAPVEDGAGGDPASMFVSAYELYTAPFGASADKVFRSQDKHPFVAGEFVWSGWDYLGEPTPYYHARSSYFGIIDLAGFPKDRYYLYQSRWRPELPFVHILPHWNWPERSGKLTPVHIFTTGDEVELFLNGKSLGRKQKTDYRLRWDEVLYEAGELKAVAYKDGKLWAEGVRKTTGSPQQLVMIADRSNINADGTDLAFIRIEVRDQDGLLVPTADNDISFSLTGAGEIVATDNGDPTDLVAFPSSNRKAFNGLALAIVRSKKDVAGSIVITATSPGLAPASLELGSDKLE